MITYVFFDWKHIARNYILYACMYVYIYIYACTCMHMYIYVVLTIHPSLQIHVCMSTYMHIYMYSLMHVFLHIYMHTHTYCHNTPCISEISTFQFIWFLTNICSDLFFSLQSLFPGTVLSLFILPIPTPNHWSIFLVITHSPPNVPTYLTSTSHIPSSDLNILTTSVVNEHRI